MKTIKTTAQYSRWLSKLKDMQAKAMILRKIRHLACAQSCDIKHISDALYELRVFAGKGYRVYYTEQKGEIIILLCAGHKDSQSRDIEQAKQLLKLIEGKA